MSQIQKHFRYVFFQILAFCWTLGDESPHGGPEESTELVDRVAELEATASRGAELVDRHAELEATASVATDTVPLHGTMNHSPNMLSKIAFQIKLRVFLKTRKFENLKV